MEEKLKRMIISLQIRIKAYEKQLKDEKRKNYQLQQQIDRYKRGQS